MAMSQEHKALLTRNRLRLIRELIPSQELYAVLMGNHTLTATMVEEIESVKTTSGKVGRLLDILPRRGSVAFPTFISALVETHQEQLATLLDSSYTLSSPSSGVVSQPRDSGPGGDQLTPSATSSSTELPIVNELGKWSSVKQPQQPSDVLSGKLPSTRVRVHEQQPSHENPASRTQSIKGWTVEEDIVQLVYHPSNQGFIYETCDLEDGEEPGKTGSLTDGRCVVFRNENLLKKHGYVKNFDDVNLSMAFKIFGIKVEATFEYKSQKEILECLCKEADRDASAFFLFMFAPGCDDVIATEDGGLVSNFKIVDIVKKSVALKGKPKVLIFHLFDLGPMDKLDSVAEPANTALSKEFSALSLTTEDDNMAILKVVSPSGDLKIHWLVSSLIFLMTKYAKNYDLCKILDYVKLILEKHGYSVTLNSTLKKGLYFTS